MNRLAQSDPIALIPGGVIWTIPAGLDGRTRLTANNRFVRAFSGDVGRAGQLARHLLMENYLIENNQRPAEDQPPQPALISFYEYFESQDPLDLDHENYIAYNLMVQSRDLLHQMDFVIAERGVEANHHIAPVTDEEVLLRIGYLRGMRTEEILAWREEARADLDKYFAVAATIALVRHKRTAKGDSNERNLF